MKNKGVDFKKGGERSGEIIDYLSYSSLGPSYIYSSDWLVANNQLFKTTSYLGVQKMFRTS